MKIVSSVILGLLLFTSCNKNKTDNLATLKKLYKTYKNGGISECTYNGETVYSASLNANDAGSSIFDKDGKNIGDCNWAWGGVDAICGETKNCKRIYCIEDNIWGYDYIDKYGLD